MCMVSSATTVSEAERPNPWSFKALKLNNNSSRFPFLFINKNIFRNILIFANKKVFVKPE